MLGTFASLGIGDVVGSIAGSYLTGKSNEKAAEENAKIQRELAQNGLSWRVEDAKKAGINPLAALGASLPSGNPVAVGTDYGDLGLGAAGQNISRAMQAQMTKEQREMHELNKRLLEVQIEGQEIENKNKLTGTPPPLKINTNPKIPLSSAEFPFEETKNNNFEIVQPKVNAAGGVGVEAGPRPMYQLSIDDEGLATTIPTNEMADLVESYTPLWIREMFRSGKQFFNSKFSALSEKQKKIFAQELVRLRPKHLKKGWEYRWDNNKVAWRPMPIINGKSYIFTEPLKDQSGIRFPMPSYKPTKKGYKK